MKPPIILETTFDHSGVTLHWEDPENICISTEYLIILYNIIPNNTYSTTNTNFTISSTELSLTANYAYKVNVMGRKEEYSNISDLFTIGENLVKLMFNCVYSYLQLLLK